MNDRIIDEIAQTVYDIKRPWSNVTMRKYDKDEEPFEARQSCGVRQDPRRGNHDHPR